MPCCLPCPPSPAPSAPLAARCPFPWSPPRWHGRGAEGVVALSVPPREQVSTCVSILERLLQALDPLYVIQNLKEELQKGLFHPDDSVKILTISQVQVLLQDGTELRGGPG